MRKQFFYSVECLHKGTSDVVRRFSGIVTVEGQQPDSGPSTMATEAIEDIRKTQSSLAPGSYVHINQFNEV